MKICHWFSCFLLLFWLVWCQRDQIWEYKTYWSNVSSLFHLLFEENQSDEDIIASLTFSQIDLFFLHRLAACSAPHKSLPSVAPQCLPLYLPSHPLQAASLHWRNFNWFVQWLSAGRTNIFSLNPSTIFHELPWALSFVNSFKISALKNFQYSFETWSNPTYFQTFQL